MTVAAEAAQLIEDHMPIWSSNTLQLEAAVGHILAEDIAADRDVPAFDRVTMDGIAINFSAYSAGRRSFNVCGVQAAGVAPLALDNKDQCVRVMTGAVLPIATDTVIPIERIELNGDAAEISSTAQVAEGQFVHRRGSDGAQGSIVLKRGTRIRSPEMAVLASVGKAQFQVTRPPRIAVISTGDELVDVAEPVLPHQIRSSNGRAIQAAITLHQCGYATRTRLRDEPADLLATISRLHAENDVLILSGGVSMGDFDFVPGALDHLGAKRVFHRIDQKPGRPMWFGVSRDGKPIFALPGNPVSTLVCLSRYVIPALRTSLGDVNIQTEIASLSANVTDGPKDWTYFVPVTLQWQRDGRLLATPHKINTSGDFASLAGTDGIAELGIDENARNIGSPVAIYKW